MLSIVDKYDIIVMIKSGVNRNDVLIEYKLKHLSHLTHILKKEKEITEKYNELNAKSRHKSFTLKTSKYPKVEMALIEWMKQIRHKKIPLSGAVILSKAKTFADLFGEPAA